MVKKRCYVFVFGFHLLASAAAREEPRVLGFVSATGIRGTWFDAGYNRLLKPRSPIYTDSSITRRDPKSANDRLPVVLRNGTLFGEFDCRTPSVCDGKLPLENAKKAALGKVATTRTIDSLVGGRSRSPGQKNIWRNAVIPQDGKLLITDILQPGATETKRLVAWCANALARDGNDGCPESPDPIKLVWTPGMANEVPVSGLGLGLHRLMEINVVNDVALWNDEACWVLIVPLDRFAGVSRGLNKIRQQWNIPTPKPDEVRNAFLAELLYLESCFLRFGPEK